MGAPRTRGNRLWRDERMIPNGIANDGETADRKAFLAVADSDMEGNLYREYLLVKKGKVREAQLDESVRPWAQNSVWSVESKTGSRRAWRTFAARFRSDLAPGVECR
jgi:hypothetical protein